MNEPRQELEQIIAEAVDGETTSTTPCDADWLDRVANVTARDVLAWMTEQGCHPDQLAAMKSALGGMSENVKRWQNRASHERHKKQTEKAARVAAEERAAELKTARDDAETAVANLSDDLRGAEERADRLELVVKMLKETAAGSAEMTVTLPVAAAGLLPSDPQPEPGHPTTNGPTTSGGWIQLPSDQPETPAEKVVGLMDALARSVQETKKASAALPETETDHD